jgi:hypothetical protein
MKFVLALSLLSCAVLAGCRREVPSEPEPARESSGTAPSESTTAESSPPATGSADEPAAKQAEETWLLTPWLEEPETIPAVLSPERAAEGWISLFDGYSIYGWEQEFGQYWRIQDGQLISEGDRPPSILTTSVPWTDFELTLEVFLDEGGNSGLFVRSSPRPQDPLVDCYEINLCDTHPAFKTGSVVGRAQPIAEARGDGGWHRVKVICEGTWIQSWLDEIHMTDFHDESPRPLLSGRIGLQQNGGTVRFRNIALRPLGTRSLFDGQTLAGWNVVPGGKSEFSVAEETIHVSDGAGFLETEEVFDNFVLQADFRTNGDGLNSGIFFRAMKGTADAPSHGYEFQIHNAYENNDPRQPSDQGTGAIFRRISARRVVGRDHEWNTVTLNAFGNRFATWVNGYPTALWQDDRSPDENPRRGRRDEAGHLSLQGHDPTTDLNFRRLIIAEHPSP